jgi:hypothetical protein
MRVLEFIEIYAEITARLRANVWRFILRAREEKQFICGPISASKADMEISL